MTRQERPSDAERPLPPSPRSGYDRDYDGDGDTGAHHATGQHRVADDVTASYPEVAAGGDRRGRLGLGGDQPDAVPPRRRRGAPPTLGIPIPPPPITKELVSDDAPKPSGFVAPLRGGLDPLSGADGSASDRPRHTERLDVRGERRPDAGRHDATPDGGDGRDASGPHSRMLDIFGFGPGHRREGDPGAEPAGRFSGFRGLRPTGGPRSPDAPPEEDAASRRRTGGRRPTGDRRPDDLSAHDQSGELRGIGAFRSNGLRFGPGRIGDALRSRGTGQTGANPRQRFGGVPEDGSSGAPSADGRAEGGMDGMRGRGGPRRGRDRDGAAGLDGHDGGPVRAGAGRPSGAGRFGRFGSGGDRGAAGGMAPPGGGPNGAMPPGGPMRPGGGPSGAMRPGGGPSGAMPPGGPMRPGGGPGAMRPGGGPSGPMPPGGPMRPGGPSGAMRPGGGPSGAMPAAGPMAPRPVSPGNGVPPGPPGRQTGSFAPATGGFPAAPPGAPMSGPGGAPGGRGMPVSPAPATQPYAHRVTAAMPTPTGGFVASDPGAPRYPDGSTDTIGPRDAATGTRTQRNVRYANQVHRRTSQGMIVAVFTIVIVLLGALPGYLLLAEHSSNRDFASIGALHLPSWATLSPVDHTSGNHWCVSACLKSDRTTASTHSVTDTATAYADALRAAGWTPAPRNACPPATDGAKQSCWVLDREQINVLVSTASCAAPPPPTTEPGLTAPALPPTAPSPSSGCSPTTVTVSLFDRIDLRTAQS